MGKQAMAKSNKRERNPTRNRDEALSKPNVWRRQQGGFTPPFRDTNPETGAAVTHRRAIDLLGSLEANGMTGTVMHDTSDARLLEFRAAAMGPTAATPLLRVPADNGTVTGEMYDAGEIFRLDFRRAAFGGMAISLLLRRPATQSAGWRSITPSRA